MGSNGGDPPLLAYAQDKVAVVDGAGTFVYVSDAAETILGFEPSALVGENAFDYVHPDDLTGTRERFRRVVDSDEPVTETGRYRHRAAGGDYVWLESRFSNVTDPELGGYVVTSRDISERVAAEREHEETARRLDELTSTVGDVLWMFSGDWSELLFVNPAYEEVYGGPVEELSADPSSFLERIHPEDRECVEAAMARLGDGESVEMEYRVDPRRDYATWVWVQGEPIEEDGEVVRIVGFARDVTDRKRRERQLAVMDNLLRHNVRNAMNVVLGETDVLAGDSDASAAHADVIRRQGERLVETAEKQRHVIELLTDADHPVRLDAVELVEHAVGVVREEFPDARVRTDLPASAPVCALAEVGEALVELLENAARHHPENAPVITVTVADDDGAVVTVTDDCPPIPEQEFRVVTGEREMEEVYHTTGLGLWLVHWAVELSDGSLTFDQAEGEGNRVTVRLPRAD